MINHLRTSLAHLIVRHLPGPRSLLRAALGWLVGETNDLNLKRRYLEAILVLEPDNEQATMALLWVLQQQQTPKDLHPANIEELTNVAQETGAEVLQGALRYPGENGGWHWGTSLWRSIWRGIVTERS